MWDEQSQGPQESYDRLLKVKAAYESHGETNLGIPIIAAQKLRDMQRKSEAYDELENAISLNPKHSESYLLRGQFRMMDKLCVQRVSLSLSLSLSLSVSPRPRCPAPVCLSWLRRLLT